MATKTPNPKRPKLPPEIADEVLIRSRRRCCLCYGLAGHLTEQRGQIAHLDGNRANNKLDNLAFMCLAHHDMFDGRFNQSKNYLKTEAKAYRNKMIDWIDHNGLTTAHTTAPAEERRRVVEQQRVEFETQAAGNRFYWFKADAGVLCVSIFPVVVPDEPVEKTMANEMRMWQIVQPIGSSGAGQFTETETEPDAIVCPKNMDVVPQSLTALTTEGAFLAVCNLNAGQDSHHDAGAALGQSWRQGFAKPYLMSMQSFQPALVSAVRRYLAGLKELGVGGPWYIGLSIQKAKYMWMLPARDFLDRSGGKPCSRDAMWAKTIRIENDADVSSDDAVFKIIQRPLKSIWKFCGRSSIPKYTSDGQWNWVD